jgi:prevent-host-death family protein
MPTQTLSLTELRPRLPEIIDRVHRYFDRFFITRHGRPEAVILSAEDFEGLLETLDILGDETCLSRLAAAEEELAQGGGHRLEEVRRELEDGEGDG